MTDLNWSDDNLRREKIEQIVAEVRQWDGAFAELQRTTQAITNRLAEMQANPDGIYNVLDRPRLVTALQTRRDALNTWEASVPGDTP